MARRVVEVCKLPLFFEPYASDSSRYSIHAPLNESVESLLEPTQIAVIPKTQTYELAVIEKAETKAIKYLFEDSMEDAARQAAKEFSDGQKLLSERIAKLGNHSPVTLAAQLGLRAEILRTNWDLFATATVRIKGVFVSQSYRVARLTPPDLKMFLLRRVDSLTSQREALEAALSNASGNAYIVNVENAKEALGHAITTDKWGLAMDFNPSDDVLEEVVRRELYDQLEPQNITDNLVNEYKVDLRAKIHQHLFGGTPETSTVLIGMTGSRTYDEIVAVRALAEQASLQGRSEWLGITSQTTDIQIRKLIDDLKNSGYVFHHAGKVELDLQGYPVVEMQLISTDAHSKILRSSGAFSTKDIDLWTKALGEEALAKSTVEQLLQHVGGCKVFVLFYGISGYR